MTPDINHDRCSELLGGYVRGELGAAEAQQVESHLQGCELCTSEHRAISALQAPETARLSEIERARMRRTVLAEAAPGRDAAPPQLGEHRGARLFRLLGAAAVAVALAVFAYTGLGDLGGSDEAATVGGDQEQADDDAGGAGGAEDAGSDEDAAPEAAEALQNESAADEGETRVGDAAGTAGRPAPSPMFEPSIRRVDRKQLNRLGRRGRALVAFSHAFQTRDVERLRDEFVDELAAAAPSARGAQMRDCAAAITSNFPTALPAYSAIADYTDRPRREVLIVAFAWTPEPEGPLDRSMVWAWPLDTCDQVVHYSKNVIAPRR